MNELRDIARALDREPAGEGPSPFVLATLVRLRGSGYRRPGARMLIGPDGSWAGFLSGGCLEADVAQRARRVIETRTAEVVTYDTRAGEDDVWGLAMGCNGIVDILLEPVPGRDDPGHPACLLARARARATGTLATVVRGDRAGEPAPGDHAWIDADGTPDRAWARPLVDAAVAANLAARTEVVVHERRPGDAVEILLEPRLPPIRLVVAGAGPDAPPLVRLAHGLGWDVAVVDPRPAFADPARFSGLDDVAVLCCGPAELEGRAGIDERTAVVVMTHHFPRDRAWLRAVLGGPAPYVGILGPRRRSRDLLDRLAAEDGVRSDDEALRRLHAPVGLDLGAASPEEIALSIAAEIRAAFSNRDGGPLRERAGPIHGPDGA